MRVEDRCRVDGWQITGVRSVLPKEHKQPAESACDRPSVEELARKDSRLCSAMLGLIAAAFVAIAIMAIPSM